MSGEKKMRRTFATTAVAVLVVLGIALVGIPASAQSSGGESEIGVSAKKIRVAVVADVDTPIAPNLLVGAVKGMQGWAKYVNANGGIGGRKVQVDFIDSKLNPNEARNAVIKACSQDFALVGTAALLLTTTSDITSCADSAGDATGIPDIAALALNVEQACAPTGYPINPVPVDCDTRAAPTQTYRVNNGPYKYLVKQHKDLHGAFVNGSDSPATERTAKIYNKAAVAAGIKDDSTWGVTSNAPQSQYTPVIQAMKSDSSNLSLMLQSVTGVISQRQEAQLQGLTDPDIVWLCTLSCYDDRVKDAGDVMNREYIPLQFLPFDEGSANPMTKNFVKYVGKGNLNGVASWGFTSGLLFERAAKAVVKSKGANGLTRANLLAELAKIHDFDAEGMVATTDIGNRIPTNCFMLDQFVDGKYVRVYPKKKGTFDCNKANLYTFEENLNG
jgi:ABC-type branched-subunit amino acid transport system substrate-binding protein